jgi:hypothetical protein
MTNQAVASDLVKKAKRASDFSFWMLPIMVVFVIGSFYFHVPAKVMYPVNLGLVLLAWAITIVEVRYLRRAVKAE